MKTIKEQESEIEESKPLTFRNDDKEIIIDKDPETLLKARHNINRSINSENSNNILTNNKDEKVDNRNTIKKESNEEPINK